MMRGSSFISRYFSCHDCYATRCYGLDAMLNLLTIVAVGLGFVTTAVTFRTKNSNTVPVQCVQLSFDITYS